MKTDTLSHYELQAAAGGDPAHIAMLIKRSRLTLDGLRLLITAVGNLAADLATEPGISGMEEVSDLLDQAGDACDEATYADPDVLAADVAEDFATQTRRDASLSQA